MARLLSANEIEKARKDLEVHLIERADILTAGTVLDGMGGQTITWGTTYPSVPCRLDERGSRLGPAAGGLILYHSYTMYFSVDQTLRLGDRVRFGDRTFTVSSVSSGYTDPLILSASLELLK